MAVASSSKDVDSVGRNCTFSWGNCPLDILILIFERLEPKDLMNCIHVNEWWRDGVTYMGQHRRMWPVLAKVAMANDGVSFRRRSNLSWRHLYFNSRLWLYSRDAELTWTHECSDSDIKNINVYRDILIVESEETLLKKYYHIKDRLVDISEKLNNTVTVHEKKDSKKLAKTPTEKKECLPTGCDKIMKKLLSEGPFRQFLVVDEYCFYVLDEKNLLRCSRWECVNKRWLEYNLARYYGCGASISDINYYDGEVYLLLKTGLVFKLDKDGRNFIPSDRMDIPTTRLLQYARLLSCNNVLNSLQQVHNFNLPQYGTGNNSMFQKCCAVISVPSDKKFKVNLDKNDGNVVLEYPDLSCALQHGEILLLGFKTGKIEISVPRKLILDDNKDPEISVKVQDCPDYKGEDPEIVALDVYEDVDCHHLFIATNSNLYRLVITYNKSLKASVTGHKSE